MGVREIFTEGEQNHLGIFYFKYECQYYGTTAQLGGACENISNVHAEAFMCVQMGGGP